VIDLTLGKIGDTATSGTDYSATYTAFYYSGGTKTSLTVTSNQITLPAGVTTFYVAATTTSDSSYEGSENLTLTAAFNSAALKYANGSSGTVRTGASASDTSSILDNGSGTVYTGDISGGSPATSATAADDDRALSVVASPTMTQRRD
jgi:hypothetical protein